MKLKTWLWKIYKHILMKYKEINCEYIYVITLIFKVLFPNLIIAKQFHE